MTLNLDFFSCLVGSSDRLSSFSGEGSLDSCREGGRDGGRDGGREGGLDGVLEGGSEPFEGPLTEEFLELCVDGGGLVMLTLFTIHFMEANTPDVHSVIEALQNLMYIRLLPFL